MNYISPGEALLTAVNRPDIAGTVFEEIANTPVGHGYIP